VFDAIVEPAATREVRRDFVEVGLQLKGGHAAADLIREMTRRTAKTGADIEDVHLARQTQSAHGLVDRFRPQIVVLVEGGELIGRDRCIGLDATGGEFVEHSIDLLVKFHPLDART
jgi:hypothetical protein